MAAMKRAENALAAAASPIPAHTTLRVNSLARVMAAVAAAAGALAAALRIE